MKAKYPVGTQIVHSIHGAGTVMGIEEKDLCGKKEEYYVLKIVNNDLVINTPVSKEENMHEFDVKKIKDFVLNFKSELIENELEDRYKKFAVDISTGAKNKNTMAERTKIFKLNSEKLKSGEIKKVAEVYLYLSKKESGRVLAIDEKKMLGQAKQFLTGNIMAAFGIKSNEAEDILKDLMSNKKIMFGS